MVWQPWGCAQMTGKRGFGWAWRGGRHRYCTPWPFIVCVVMVLCIAHKEEPNGGVPAYGLLLVGRCVGYCRIGCMCMTMSRFNTHWGVEVAVAIRVFTGADWLRHIVYPGKLLFDLFVPFLPSLGVMLLVTQQRR